MEKVTTDLEKMPVVSDIHRNGFEGRAKVHRAGKAPNTSIYRYAVSMLSKENVDRALSQEMMVDKSTGEVLIKTKDGDVISYDRLSRSKSFHNRIEQKCLSQGFHGVISSVEMETDSLPKSLKPITLPFDDETLTKNIETVNEDIVLKNSLNQSIKNFKLFLDIDTVSKTSKFGYHGEENLKVEFLLSLSINDTIKEDKYFCLHLRQLEDNTFDLTRLFNQQFGPSHMAIIRDMVLINESDESCYQILHEIGIVYNV